MPAPLRRLAALWLVGTAVFVVLVTPGPVPAEQVLLDPATLAGQPWYLGLVSNLGVLGWSAATAIAGAGAWLARVGGRRRAGDLLMGAALLSALWTLDDLFQLHILVGERSGLGKPGVYAAYLGLVAVWAAGHRDQLPRTPLVLLAAALAALAASAGLDQIGDGGGRWLVAEDGAKFLAIVAWLGYVAESAAGVARSVLQPPDRDVVAGHRP